MGNIWLEFSYCKIVLGLTHPNWLFWWLSFCKRSLAKSRISTWTGKFSSSFTSKRILPTHSDSSKEWFSIELETDTGEDWGVWVEWDGVWWEVKVGWDSLVGWDGGIRQDGVKPDVDGGQDDEFGWYVDGGSDDDLQ